LEKTLATLPPVTALGSRQASARLIDVLTDGRWRVMQRGPRRGRNVARIGQALGRSRQGAQDWHRRDLELRVQFGSQQDNARGRAVLGETGGWSTGSVPRTSRSPRAWSCWTPLASPTTIWTDRRPPEFEH
jgi:hypothetical protein